MERADTIAAISTPFGAGGIAVIRISGPEARRVLSSCFIPSDPLFPAGRKDLSFGRVADPEGRTVDEAVALFFEGPRSYTGEDVSEIQCHGGIAVAKTVLSLAIAAGARQARAGEFSRRALFYGKMDVAKAEAVLAMVEAKTEKARQAASRMMEGEQAAKVAELKEAAQDLVARMEAGLDWPDETKDLDEASVLPGEIAKLESRSQDLLEEIGRGRLLFEGISVAIIGRPNMGKSSLLNRLLGTNRALVSDIPGTTRDTVEETANVEGIPIRFVDTAGLGSTRDPLVEAGVERAKKAASEASIVLYVADLPAGLEDVDIEELTGYEPERVIIVLNKSDLLERGAQVTSAPRSLLRDIKFRDSEYCIPGYLYVLVSAISGVGMEELRKAIAEKAAGTSTAKGAETKQSGALAACIEAFATGLGRARRALEKGLPVEVSSLEMREALYAIGEIFGDTSGEDILDKLFARFCVGK